RGAAHLVEVDGADEEGADDDLLPVRLDAEDDEAVAQRGGDEEADDGAEHRADPAEEARATDDDAGDDVEVGEAVPGDRRRPEEGEVEDAGQPGEEAGEGVDLDELAVDVDAVPAAGLRVRADRRGVEAE